MGEESSLTDSAGQSRGRERRFARVLEADPELGLRLTPGAVGRARVELMAPVHTLDRGVWQAPAHLPDDARLGFLVLDGMLARDLVLGGHACTELLGEGDVLEPTPASRAERLVPFEVLWQVLEPIRIAVLDDSFARALAQWPPVASALMERTIRRMTRMSIHQALLQLSPVETRLLVMFWFLAERWGRVTPDGISLRLRLTHQLIGQLVGARRASVTTGLQHVAASGLVLRRSDRTWLLRGPPPQDLAHLHWPVREVEGDVADAWVGAARQSASP